MKKILLTGGMGFIGSHLLNTLTKGNEVDIVDNFANNSIQNFQGTTSYHLSVDKFNIDDHKYDQIYHLASPVGPAGVLKYAGTMIVNDGLKIANYGYKNHCKVLYVSTSEVYGTHPGGITGQKEDIDKIVPAKTTVRLEYGVGKLLMEISLSNFARNHPFEYNIIRPFNTVGIGQSSSAGFVIPRMVYQALTGIPITVFGIGKQVRAFTHVDDLSKAFVDITESDISGEIFNAGNPDNIISINDLALLIHELAKSSSEIIHIDPKTVYGNDYEEAWNKIPDIDKIQNAINWKPTISIETIVKEVIKDTKRMISSHKFRPNHGIK